MPKILIHIGPPKTATTHLQRLLKLNTSILKNNSIDYLPAQFKDYIRSYHKKKRNTSLIADKNSLKSWFLTAPETNFFNKSSNHVIISEEGIFRSAKDSKEIHQFDNFLSQSYSERIYLIVLREINTYTTSNISQAIKGLRCFNYRNCIEELKKYSLDRSFSGMMNTNMNLEIAKFSDFINQTNYLTNISSVLEKTLGISRIKLEGINGVSNASLDAEGTAIHLAYNNIIQKHLGNKSLAYLNKKIVIKTAKKFREEISNAFSKQQKFCPFSIEEQNKFMDLHLAKSQKFIDRFPGNWIDEVFTPTIRDKNITLVSEMNLAEKEISIQILEHHIYEFLNKPCFQLNPTSLDDIKDMINLFLKQEPEIVL